MPLEPPQQTPEQAAQAFHIQSLMALVVTPITDMSIKLHIQSSIDFEVHPLYRRPRWLGVDEAMMLSIGPALVLATRLLTCNASLQFIHGFLYGKKTPVLISGQWYQTFHRVYNNPSQDMPPHDEQQVRNILNELASCINLKFAHIDPRLLATTDSNTKDFISPGLPGTQSRILLQSKLLTELDLNSSLEHPLCRRWVSLAVTLNHETIHALCNAVHGVAAPEMYFENQTHNEMGWAWEEQVLGGSIHLRDEGTPAEKLICTTVPTQSINEVSMEVPAMAAIQVERSNVGGNVIREVEGQLLEDLFDPRFWGVKGLFD